MSFQGDIFSSECANLLLESTNYIRYIPNGCSYGVNFLCETVGVCCLFSDYVHAFGGF